MFAGGEPAGAERRSGRFGGWKTFPEMCAKMKKENRILWKPFRVTGRLPLQRIGP